MGSITDNTVFIMKFPLIFGLTLMFYTLSSPILIINYFKKKVTFKEPDVVNDPNLGQHDYLTLKRDNVKIHYVHKGEKGKKLMLFVHGFPEFWYSWRYQLPEFGQDHFAVAIDNVGYGKSTKGLPVEKYYLGNIASYIKEFINSLGYETCILVGHDFGAAKAFQVAGDYPDLIEKLIILNGPPPYLDFMWKVAKKDKMQLMRSVFVFIFFQVPYLSELLLSGGNCSGLDGTFKGKPNVTDEDVVAYKYTFQQGGFTDPLNYYRMFFKKIQKKSKSFKMPSLVIWGVGDTSLSIEFPRTFQEIFTNVKVHYIENATHWVNLDAYKEVNETIRSFLKE